MDQTPSQDIQKTSKPLRAKKDLPELIEVSKKAGKAIMEFDMIREGDRVAVAVSGGKDSLSLLHVLRHRQRISPVNFDFTAAHIDFEFADFNPKALVEYFEQQRFAYFVEKAGSLKGQRYEDIDCFRWSRNRRKALFDLAAREGFTKIAFGHHLDDIAETIVLNQFYRGEIGAMKPKLELFGGKVAIIRPLAYVREREMENLARKLQIDSMGQSKCANDDTSHRMLIKQMLRDFEKNNPMVVTNIFHSLRRINPDYLTDTVKGEQR
jgi:tRNA 2-thiocytidine biosynthesis protein TtcA